MSSHSIILKTKITLPVNRESILIRRRLIQLLDHGMNGRLTFVCAPPGFGKTTLISQWLADIDHGCGWVSLDELDNDCVKIWRYIVHAMAGAVSQPIGERLLQIADQLPNLSVYNFLDVLMNELHSLSEPLILVLDDYHTIDNDHIHTYLSYFIDYLPDHVHLVIASRRELPFPTSKWNVRNQRLDIDAMKLQFTFEETEMFYQKISGLPLSTSQIKELFQRTEGWAACLQLVAIALQSSTNYDIDIEQFAGDQRNVTEYLFQEVIAKLTPDVYDFLQRTSVLYRMDSFVCDAVTGRTDSIVMLDKLKTLNLFIVPLDDKHNWYRYHHLFAEFLHNQVRRTQPEQWQESHSLASRCFAARGLLDEAIDHAILAQDGTYAIELLEQYIQTSLWRGEFATLLRWLETLESELSVNLSLIHAFLYVAGGLFHRAQETLDQLELRYQTEQRVEQRKLIRSGMLFVKSNLVFYTRDYDGWFAFTEEIDRLEDILTGSSIFYHMNVNWNEPLVRRTAFGLKGLLSSDTEKIGLRFTSLLESHGWKDSLINLYVNQSLSEGYYEWNRLHESLAIAHKIGEIARVNQIGGLIVPNRITQARIYIAAGNAQIAHDTIDEAMRIVTGLGELHWLKSLRAIRLRLFILEGNLAAAKKELVQLGISAKERPTPDRMFEYLALIRLLGAQRKESEALRLLMLLKPKAIRESCLSSITEITLLQACLEMQRGQRTTALQYMHEALIVGEAHGYVRSFVDEGQAIFELLHMYVRRMENDTRSHVANEVSREYVWRLIEHFPQNQEESAAASALVEPLNQRELQILSLIKQGATNRRIAEETSLTEGTVKVYLSRIYGKLGVSSRTQALRVAIELELI